MYTFSEKRYLTRGVSEELDPVLTLFLWQLVDNLVKLQPKTTDYLQVFDLSPENDGTETFQKITHRQEVPPYSKTHRIRTAKAVQRKIFVIDDQTHSTMLFAEEY